jgi:hypothetical protein
VPALRWKSTRAFPEVLLCGELQTVVESAFFLFGLLAGPLACCLGVTTQFLGQPAYLTSNSPTESAAASIKVKVDLVLVTTVTDANNRFVTGLDKTGYYAASG